MGKILKVSNCQTVSAIDMICLENRLMPHMYCMSMVHMTYTEVLLKSETTSFDQSLQQTALGPLSSGSVGWHQNWSTWNQLSVRQGSKSGLQINWRHEWLWLHCGFCSKWRERSGWWEWFSLSIDWLQINRWRLHKWFNSLMKLWWLWFCKYFLRWLGSCSCGFKGSSWCSGRRQRFADLAWWRLHKLRRTNEWRSNRWAVFYTARLKHRVGLSWGRLDKSLFGALFFYAAHQASNDKDQYKKSSHCQWNC